MHIEHATRLGMVVLLALVGACGQRDAAKFEQRGVITSVSRDQATYTTNDAVIVSWDAMPGNQYDWVSIAVAGSPDDTLVLFDYTGSTIIGSRSFRGLTAGTYVARVYTNNNYNKLAESASFTVTTASSSGTVSTNNTAYTTTDTVVVTYGGLPGTPTDWVSIEPSGSPVGTVVQFSYTSGTPSGTLSFSGLAVGSYVARTYGNNGFVMAAESAVFTVSAGTNPYTVTTNASNYSTGSPVTVTFAGGPGGPYDWISISASGSPQDNVVDWTYISGQASGSVIFNGLAAGSYVARLHLNNSYVIAQESAVFTVTVAASVTTDKTNYSTAESVVVTYGNMARTPTDYIAIFTSPGDTYVTFQYTSGTPSGTLSFGGLTAGSYRAKAFFNNDPSSVKGTSAVFNVAAANVTVTTNASSYTTADPVIVSYSGMAGGVTDYIGIYTAPGGAFVTFQYTGGGASGQLSFSGLAVGTYEARAFFNNGSVVQGTSSTFNVTGAVSNTTVTTDAGSYPSGSPVQVSWTNMSGSQTDYVSIFTFPGDTFVDYQYTYGPVNGSTTFNGLAAGTYVVRAFFNGGYVAQAQSAPFTINM